MSLQFIFGNSGSGKSTYLYQKIIEESMQRPDGNFIVIVPEQFTMQTQKDLVMAHPRGGIMNIDVLSFQRLAHRIFEEVGADQRSVLTETGKNLMLRKVAIREQERLKVLGSRMNRPGYVSEVKSVLSELMQYEVSDFELQEMERRTENRPLLNAKLEDLQVLYREFLSYRRDRFLKPEEIYDVLCQVAGESALLKNSVLAFDGFAGFTPSQIRVLEELLVCCPKVYLTVTLDARESAFGKLQEHDLFAPSRRLVQAVSEAARSAARRMAGNDTMFLPPVVLGKTSLPRFKKGGALFHLEQNLFRSRRQSYGGIPNEISMHISKNPAAEVHFAARTISYLVREKDLRYRDIAVITGDLSSYNNYVKHIFPQYEIPAFVDETRQILLNPCLEFVRGALEIVQRDYAAEAVFRCLRTGMAGFSADETDELENYVLAAGIRGHRKWKKTWEYRPAQRREEALEKVNAYRERLVERFEPFAEKMRKKGNTLLFYATALYELLRDCEISRQLQERAAQLEADGEMGQAREYGQVYGILIRLLDEMAELLGEETMEVQEFTEILEAGLSEAKVGVIPPGIDQVQVGDIRRTRLAHVKNLFFLGLNDGWVPARGNDGGIVSDMERELLKENGMELAPTARENSYIQRFYLYQNLTKPSQHLYLSWCLGSSDGVVMRPSYLVSNIRRLFPKITVCEEKEPGSELWQTTTRKNGMQYFLHGLQEARMGNVMPKWKELYRSYAQDDEYRERVRKLVQAAFSGGAARQLSFSASKKLYGEVMTNSVTRLEQFAACAFAHFAMYGLRLRERELYGVKPADLGILFHRSLELFSRRIAVSGRDWTELTEQEETILMEQCVDEVSEKYGADALHSDARSAYTINRLKRILCRSAWVLHEQLAAGSFRPSGFEVSFADAGNLETVNVSLGGYGRMHLQGRIDRIDTAQTEDAVYVKVVDYKSGMAEFDPVSFYYGLQMQLVVYLNAALEMEQRLHPERVAVPAGIFYYRMQDPVLEKEAGADEAAMRERLLKKLRPDGIINEDDEVLELLDHGFSGDSLVIPAGRKKDGSLKAASKTVTPEQFQTLSRFARRKLTQLGERMLGGEVAPDPYEADGRTPCDYCDYADVCGFDRKIPGSCPHRLEPLGKDEVWIRMEQELKQEASDRSEEAQRKSPELSEESWRELEEALRSMHMEETDKAGEGE
ncbi:MAG: helicase-exonuclease AddAB subunit AddB [Lachnospiraceae bacterium]